MLIQNQCLVSSYDRIGREPRGINHVGPACDFFLSDLGAFWIYLVRRFGVVAIGIPVVYVLRRPAGHEVQPEGIRRKGIDPA